MKTTSFFGLSGFIVLSLAACSKPVSVHQTATVTRLSSDFFVTRLNASPAAAAVAMAVSATPASPMTRAECEAHITKVVCETNATTDEISQNYGTIQCAGNSSQYVPALMSIYDEMPARMQPSLCSLDRIFLSDGIPSTAFASSVEDALGRRIGGYVGMRKATFLQQPTTHDLVTWKEQLAFGGSTKFLSNDPKLVQINYGLKLSTLPTDGLFYVLMHELGHLIDFGNEVNSSDAQTPWAKLSWQTKDTPLANATFLKRDDFCFYNCHQYLNASDAKAIYSSMQQSAFLTSYSSSNIYEDFAEFWAWRLMLESKNPNYEIVVPGEATLDMMPVITSNAKIKAKLAFMTQLWNSPALKVDNRATPSPSLQ